MSIFNGKLCNTCGNTERYVKTKRCVFCWREKARTYSERNSAKKSEYASKYRSENPEYMEEYREKNKDKILKQQRKYKKLNRATCNASTRLYKEKIRQSSLELSYLELTQVKLMYYASQLMTSLLGEPVHVDHITPVSKGGQHHPSNLQLLLGVDNIKKGAKLA